MGQRAHRCATQDRDAGDRVPVRRLRGVRRDLPGEACTGRNWRQGMPREAFWDPKACMAGMQQVSMARLGRSGICGMCIAACPFTQAYLRRAGSL